MEKADKRKYAEDKPLVCEDCYFWSRRKNGCTRKQCYYLLPKQPEKDTKKQDSVWVALMENILLVLDTVCRKFYRT